MGREHSTGLDLGPTPGSLRQMRNHRVYLAALLLLLSACKSKSPEPAESPAAPSPSTTAGSDPSTRRADGADESDESAAAAGTSAGQEALDEAALYERHMVATLRQVLSQRHLRQLKMDDQVSSQAFDVFIKRLDPAKLYFEVACGRAGGDHRP